MDATQIPRHIDEPVTLLIWQADEFVPFFVVLMAGMLAGHLFLALVLACLSLKGYRRFKDQRPDGVALDLAYWWGLLPAQGHSRPNPWIRRYTP